MTIITTESIVGRTITSHINENECVDDPGFRRQAEIWSPMNASERITVYFGSWSHGGGFRVSYAKGARTYKSVKAAERAASAWALGGR